MAKCEEESKSDKQVNFPFRITRVDLRIMYIYSSKMATKVTLFLFSSIK
jgi:hypothetical protein